MVPWLDPLKLLDLRYWHVVDVWAIGARETQRQIVAPTAKREWKILILFFNL